MIISSIRLSLVGAQVDCSTNTSWPRTFSLISTMISPSEKREHTARPSGMFRCCTTACASFGLALPENTIKLSDTIATISSPSIVVQIGMAGEEGFEPSNGGIKIRCLNQLGDSPARKLTHDSYVPGPCCPIQRTATTDCLRQLTTTPADARSDRRLPTTTIRRARPRSRAAPALAFRMLRTPTPRSHSFLRCRIPPGTVSPRRLRAPGFERSAQDRCRESQVRSQRLRLRTRLRVYPP